MKPKHLATAVLAIAAIAVASPAASLAGAGRGPGPERWSAGSRVNPNPIDWCGMPRADARRS